MASGCDNSEKKADLYFVERSRILEAAIKHLIHRPFGSLSIRTVGVSGDGYNSTSSDACLGRIRDLYPDVEAEADELREVRIPGGF